MNSKISKAQGCLAGLCVGDALGSQFEFIHPFGLQILDDKELGMMIGSNIFHTKTGQITDDAEMALCLTQSLIDHGTYKKEYTKHLYQRWALSNPVDIGVTIRCALNHDILNPKSESNGSLMRIAPLGIYCATKPHDYLLKYSAEDASITHANKKVSECNFMYTYAIALAISKSYTNTRIIELVRGAAQYHNMDVSLLDQSNCKPEDYYTCMGHVEIAFMNAFYYFRLGYNYEHAIINTIRMGGDTDTNAAICGALIGAYLGVSAIPSKWLNPVLNCDSNRPEKYQTKNILSQSEKLLTLP